MEIFKKNKKEYLKNIYNVPENYFNELNPKLENRINSLESKKSKIILLNQLFKAAAMFLLLIGFYFIFNYSTKIENISYVQLNESIDEVIALIITEASQLAMTMIYYLIYIYA